MSRASMQDDRIPPGQHLVKGWPVLTYGPVPSFNPAAWTLKIFGEVQNPVEIGYDELKALPPITVHADFHCVTKFSVLDNDWEGVSFRSIAALVKPTPAAKHVVARCDYGYASNLSLEAMLDDDVLLAWGRNGEPLTPDHGFPLRLIVPKRYAWKSAKWVRALEFKAEDERGFWEVRGYHNNADPWQEQRYSYQETS